MMMKRQSLALLTLLLVITMALPSVARSNKELQSIQGRVAYQAPGEAVRPIALKAAIVLADRDVAITASNSLAALSLPDSSRVLLGSNTRVLLSFFHQTTIANAKFVIYQGITRFTVQHPKGARANYTFQTPTAQIAVRGTVGDIFVDSARLQINIYSLGDPTLPVRVTLVNGNVYFIHAGQSFISTNAGATISTAHVVALTSSLTLPFTEFNVVSKTSTALLARPLVIIPAAVAGAVLVTSAKAPPVPPSTPTPVPGGLTFKSLPTPPAPPMPPAPSGIPTPHAPGPPGPGGVLPKPRPPQPRPPQPPKRVGTTTESAMGMAS
ncbi:MAG: FecR domain-containing protein [Vulcanimicrobiaceae bacterium]